MKGNPEVIAYLNQLLAGELAAAWITGSPCPLDADTRDAVDPGRWWLRPPRALPAAD